MVRAIDKADAMLSCWRFQALYNLPFTILRGRLHVLWQSVPENGGCDRKRATAGCWQTVRRECSCSVNDDCRRRRPGRLDTETCWFIHGGA